MVVKDVKLLSKRYLSDLFGLSNHNCVYGSAKAFKSEKISRVENSKHFDAIFNVKH